MSTRRLVVLGGSRMAFRRTSIANRALPASNRYNSPIFTACALAVNHGILPYNTDIFILSPKHGLIRSSDFIGTERGATPANCRKVGPFVQQALKQLLGTGNYTGLFFDLSKQHMEALDGWTTSLPIVYAEGGPEVRAQLLLQWLGIEDQYAAVFGTENRTIAISAGP